MSLRVRLLGTAAGGGVPQWNCACEACRLARAGDPRVSPRTQTSIAVSGDGERWCVVDASPDLRQQLAASPAFAPRGEVRHSPIAAVLLTSAEIDHVAGLLSLREGSFALYATTAVLEELDKSRIFAALDRARVPRRRLPLDEPTIIRSVGGDALGVEVVAFAVPGKVPLYRERAGVDPTARVGEDTIALRIGPLAYVPSCGAVTAELRARVDGAELILFDGTAWADDDLARAGAVPRSARQMGHLPLGGSGGALAALAGVRGARRRLVHINNTNPVLVDGSAARRAALEAGWGVAVDGEEHEL